MSKELRPMRGSIAERDKLVFPYMASPKYDGVRCFIKDSVAYTKSGKPFANKFIQRFATGIADGLDGELICGDPLDPMCFRHTSAQVRRINGVPEDMKFYVFDVIPNESTPGTYKAEERYKRICDHIKYFQEPKNFGEKRKKSRRTSTMLYNCDFKLYNCDFNMYRRIRAVPMILVTDILQLDAYENRMLQMGYEGVMLRSPNSPYKHGLSTVNENYLLKLKRFSDGEATGLRRIFPQ